MSPANMFKHFHSKAELVYAVMEQRLQPKETVVNQLPCRRLQNPVDDVFTELFTVLRDEPQPFSLLSTVVSADKVAQPCIAAWIFRSSKQ